MPYWDCPRCAAENSLTAVCCWRCGYQYYPGYTDPPDRRDPEPDDPVHAQSAAASKELKDGLADALDKSRATLDRLARKGSGAGGAK